MAPQEQSQFQYEPLDRSTNSFRLCTLLPSRQGTAVECKLTHKTISKLSRQYCALSYTWGNPADQKCIRINGKEFFVRQNLLLALDAVRTTDEEQLIWIDAICIDQKDISERNYQVSMMGEIFGNAKKVLSWVGPAADDSDRLLEIAEKYYGRQSCVTKEDGSAIAPNPPKVEKDVALVAFKLFSQRDYWRRAWIRQEIVLSNDLTIYCGSKSVAGWNVLVLAWLLYTEEDVWENQVSDLHISRSKMHRHDGTRRPMERLEDIVRRYGRSECHDRHDKLFALLSLACDTFEKTGTIVGYELDAPVLYFAMMELSKPIGITEFIGTVQEMFAVRTLELLKYVDIVLHSGEYRADHPMEKLAVAFISSVVPTVMGWDQDELDNGRPPKIETNMSGHGQTTEEWHERFMSFMKNQMSFHGDDVRPDFRIDGTDFAIRAGITPWGLIFDKVFRPVFTCPEAAKVAVIGVNVHEDDWIEYSPTKGKPLEANQQAALVTALQHTLAYGGKLSDFKVNEEQCARDEAVKLKLQEIMGIDPDKPSIEAIIEVLLRLSDVQSLICITVCRYILTTLYGFKLVPPRVYRDSQQMMVVQMFAPGQDVAPPMQSSLFEGRM
jgi:hypothetical protein